MTHFHLGNLDWTNEPNKFVRKSEINSETAMSLAVSERCAPRRTSHELFDICLRVTEEIFIVFSPYPPQSLNVPLLGKGLPGLERKAGHTSRFTSKFG